MSIKTIVVTGMLLLAGTIVSGQTSTNQVKEKNMENGIKNSTKRNIHFIGNRP